MLHYKTPKPSIKLLFRKIIIEININSPIVIVIMYRITA